MKPLHIGLLVIGAALAGGLAVRMAEPPPLPTPSRVHAAPVSQPAPVTPSAPAEPLTAVRKTQIAAAPVVAPVIAPAPPPIYSEPPHVEQSARRKPFGDPAPTRPVEIARAAPPAVAPVPYEPSPAPAPTPIKAPVVEEPPHVTPSPPHQVVLEAGAPVTVRLVDTLSTDRAATGDIFQAALTDPLIANGLVVAERGARVTGRVSDARRAGRLTGASFLELRLLDITTADGQRVALTCDPWLKRADSNSPMAGAITLSGQKPVTIPGQTVLRFRLASRLTITERRL